MSIQASIIKAVSRRQIKRSGLNQEQLIRHLRRAFGTPSPTFMARGTRLRRINSAQFEGDHISTPNPSVTVLYFHGGGYVGGVLKTYHNLASRLAKRLGGEVYLPVYPFAPEHPFPHAVNRVFSAYEFLLAQGKEPHNIVIAGDSAGGGLTLATLLQIRDKGLPQPRCAIAFSPGTNALPDDTTLAQRDRSDAMLSADIIRGVLEAYLPDTSQRTHAYANPASADYTGICPLLITVSSEEVLYDDSVRVKQQAQKAGIPVRWIERPGLFHVWPIMVPFLPEANRELKNVVGFIHQHATR